MKMKSIVMFLGLFSFVSIEIVAQQKENLYLSNIEIRQALEDSIKKRAANIYFLKGEIEVSDGELKRAVEDFNKCLDLLGSFSCGHRKKEWQKILRKNSDLKGEQEKEEMVLRKEEILLMGVIRKTLEK